MKSSWVGLTSVLVRREEGRPCQDTGRGQPSARPGVRPQKPTCPRDTSGCSAFCPVNRTELWPPLPPLRALPPCSSRGHVSSQGPPGSAWFSLGSSLSSGSGPLLLLSQSSGLSALLFTGESAGSRLGALPLGWALNGCSGPRARQSGLSCPSLFCL
ncbi:Hypothetical predicted protein, partial [Lynx pardinus]